MRMATAFAVLFIALAWHGAASAQSRLPEDQPKLCDDGEDLYFSCPLENGKTVSVCADGNTSPDCGYVQYRYGSRGDAFAIPGERVPPGRAVGITDVSEGSIRGLHLKFSRGPYTYVVSSVAPGGVHVVKSGRVVFDKACGASQYKSFANRVFDGINQAPPTKADRY